MQTANVVAKSFGEMFSVDSGKQFCYVPVHVCDLKLQQALQFVWCLFVLPAVRGGREGGFRDRLKQKRL